MKRRKKDPQDAPQDKKQPAQAPLQPAYFDGEAASPAAPDRQAGQPPQGEAENPQTKAVEPRHREADEERQPDQAPRETKSDEIANPGAGPAKVRPTGSVSRPGRRRRGRGGRGRSGSRPLAARPAVAISSELPAAGDIIGASQSGTQPTQSGEPVQSQTPRVPKGVVVLAIGLPGSGKSSWFKRHNIAPLSSDLLRALLFDDPTEQRFQDLVFSNLRSMLKARLIARRPMNYVDATNLTSHDRRGWIKLAQDYGYEVQAVFFDVPLEVCLERNRKRERVVSEDVMRRMAAKQKPPTFEEGFSKITVVRVKQKE